MRTAFLIALALSLTACKKEEDSVAKTKRALEEGIKSAELSLEKARTAAADTLRSQLDAARRQLDTISQRADQAGDSIKQAARPYIDEARRQADAIEPQIDALRKAGITEWQSIAEKIAPMMQQMTSAIGEALKKIGG